VSPAPHCFSVRVYYEDTDAGGIVYHAAYLHFAERARTEMLRAQGFDHVGLQREHGILFAVRRCTIEFMAPARLDDLLMVETRPLRLGGARMVLEQKVIRDETVLVVLEVELAVLGHQDLRPRRLPEAVRASPIA
jgi:acyl-CoA thioester hydrolase